MSTDETDDDLEFYRNMSDEDVKHALFLVMLRNMIDDELTTFMPKDRPPKPRKSLEELGVTWDDVMAIRDVPRRVG